MKTIIFISILLLTTLSAQADIQCDNGKTVITRGLKPHREYQEASIRTSDPELTQHMSGQNKLQGTLWEDRRNKSATALFHIVKTDPKTDAPADFLYLLAKPQAPGQEIQAIITIERPSKIECLEWEETCSCCYYGDCERQCLNEVTTPGITYIKKTVTCQEI